MLSFHAYPSQRQIVESYSRAVPLKCDTIEWDTTGCFVPFDPAHPTTTGCFVAPGPCVVEFHANVLFGAPNNWSQCAVWFMKNELPPPGGTVGGEIAGDDVSCYQPPNYNNGSGVAYNISARVTRMIKMLEGDRVWAVPGINGNMPNGSPHMLCGSIGGLYNNVNYFEGKIVG